MLQWNSVYHNYCEYRSVGYGHGDSDEGGGGAGPDTVVKDEWSAWSCDYRCYITSSY